LCEIATMLKVGTTSLVLGMIEDRALTRDFSLEKPVPTLHAVSHDPTLKTLVRLRDGTRMTAVEMQLAYLEQAQAYVASRGELDEDTREVLERWESVLTRLARDPMECAREIDWVAKLSLLQGFRDREELAWDSPRLGLIDIQWSDIRPERGLYYRLAERGRVERLLTDEAIEAAVEDPPEDTRAYFRGRCLAQFGDSVAAASWDSVIFDIPGHDSLQRVPMLEPLRGTRATVGALMDRCDTVEQLLEALAG
jgi:proteasome accessory factor A